MALTWGATEPELVKEIALLMGRIIQVTDPQEVFVPLGVGRHIDHRLVFDAFRALSGHITNWDSDKTNPKLPGDLSFWCYEERPYALVDQATKMRLRELGYPVQLDSPRFFASFWSAHYVQKFFQDARERPMCGANYMESIRARLRAKKAPVSRLFTSDATGAIWGIVSSYQSQLADFVGDRRQFEWLSRLESRRRRSKSRYVERQWNPLRQNTNLTVTRDF